MSAMLKPSTTCPCESAQTFLGKACCEEIIAGTRKAQSAPELLRARYTAFTMHDMAFITATTHPRVRAEFDEASNRRWAETSAFTKLEIFNTVADGENAAYVTFEAHFTRNNQKETHRERSRFEKENGEWYFVDGEILKPQTVRYDAPQPGRNQPCPCGSGKKYKKCCAK